MNDQRGALNLIYATHRGAPVGVTARRWVISGNIAIIARYVSLSDKYTMKP